MSRQTTLDRVTIGHSPLTDSLYLYMFGKNPLVALAKRECEGELFTAITHHMMHEASNGSTKVYTIDGQRYKMTVTPVLGGRDED